MLNQYLKKVHREGRFFNLMFDTTFFIGYVFWCSTPGILFLIYFIPVYVARGIYYSLGRSLLEINLKNKNMIQIIIVQLLYLTTSFFMQDMMTDVSSGCFFGLIRLPDISDLLLHFSAILLCSSLILFYIYNKLKYKHESELEVKSVVIKGFLSYPALSISLCVIIYCVTGFLMKFFG